MKSKKLYVVYDKIGETFVTDIMVADNDIIMVRGFQTFLEQISEDDKKKLQYSPVEYLELRCLSVLDDKFNLKENSGYVVCTGKNYDEIMKILIDNLED